MMMERYELKQSQLHSQQTWISIVLVIDLNNPNFRRRRIFCPLFNHIKLFMPDK